ncbi:MAG: 3'-5' exonuclease, partial [Clostridia bacterium]|nr:3'-5' exonuclease [Clostridia bacterium]
VGSDENDEAYYCAMQIKSLMARYNLKYSDFAVFMRLNALSRAFEQEFTKYSIPYKIFGGFRFFERKEIKDVLSYLKVVNNPYDNESFLRAISSPKRGIGDKTLHEITEFSTSRGLSVFFGIERADETTLNSASQTKLLNFRKLLESFKEYSETHKISELIKHVLETTDFMEQFADKNEENASRIMNINELVNTAEQYDEQNGENGNLSEFLNSVTLSSDTDDINSDDCVTVATIHSVKGLEFPIVFVSGLDENVLPVSRTFDDDDDMEEERRLMYVAVTRARERLFLTRANSRYMYGRREYMVESRFLKEARGALSPQVGSSFVGNRSTYNYGYDNKQSSQIGSVKNSGYSSNYAKDFLKQNNKPLEQKGVDFGGYKPGVKVKHPKFGEGTIVSVRGEGQNLNLDVAFKGLGIKSLSAKFAPLEIVK